VKKRRNEEVKNENVTGEQIPILGGLFKELMKALCLGFGTWCLEFPLKGVEGVLNWPEGRCLMAGDAMRPAGGFVIWDL
jgi:hypothetical protein